MRFVSVPPVYANHHAWLRRKPGCTFEAADLAHDTCVRLIASRRLPRPEESRACLVQIPKGLVVDLYRGHALAWISLAMPVLIAARFGLPRKQR